MNGLSTGSLLKLAAAVPTFAPMPLEQKQTGMLRRATEVIGDDAEAMRWMARPLRAIDCATPTSLFRNAKGCEAVQMALGDLSPALYERRPRSARS